MNIAIVGAGPVGIYFAKLSLEKGHKVTLIESGNLNEESSHLSRKKYIFLSPSAIPEGVHKIGGGSNQWKGRISEFLPEDFRKIYSGKEFHWPFDKIELDGHYKKLYKFLNCGESSDSEIVDKYFNSESRKMPNDIMLRVFRYCKPDSFISLYNAIKTHPNLEILDNHFCNKIHNNILDKILSLELIPESSKSILKNFDKIAIACGTLQTTALLERSKEVFKKSDNLVLGKYLTEHLEGFIGTVIVKRSDEKSLFKKLSLNKSNVAINDYDGIGVALSLRNVSLLDQLNVQYEFRKLMPKPYFFAKVQNNDTYSKVSALIRASLITERIIKFVLRKFLRIFDALLRINRYGIYIKSEEVPFVDSTLSLDTNTGNKLAYSHRVSSQTFELLWENINNFQKSFNNAFDANLKLYKEIQDIGSLHNFFGPNWHPMGTAKMGLESSNSICDSNLQVHGVDNLFLISGAVFPTGSNTNPTFTVLALANRLIESNHFKLT
jgi:hypothetical protein